MAAKSKYLLFVLLFPVCTAFAQNQPEVDSLHRHFYQATTDSAHWYYSIKLAARLYRTNLDSALHYAHISLDYAERQNSPYQQANSLSTLGAIYQSTGDNETALKYVQRALDLSQAHGLDNVAGNALINLGVIHKERSDLDRALPYFRQALRLKTSVRDTLGIMQAMSNIADIWMHKDNPDSALYYNLACLRLLDTQPNQQVGRMIVLFHLGQLYAIQKNGGRARPYLREALQLAEASGDKTGQSNTLWLLAVLDMDEGHPEAAIPRLDQALAIARDIPDRQQESDVMRGLAQSWASRRDTQKAYDYLWLYQELRDTIMQQERKQSFAELETRYQTQQKEAELARQQVVITQQQSRQQQLFFGALVLVLGLLGLFQYFRNRQRLRQKETRYALALEQAEAAQLRELDRSKSAFFANISHEFRTPLTLILGPIQKWLSLPASPAIAAGEGGRQNPQIEGGQPIPVPAKDLHLVRRNAARLLELVNQLLDLSRLESGRLQLAITAGDVGQALRVIAHTYESMAEQGGIRYDIQLPEGPLPGWFDRDKLEKIVGNLLSNAFKNTPPGGLVTLQAEVQEAELHLTVADTGRGIPAAERDRIFERFYQVETMEGGRDLPGSGIGLALVKELVMLHRGRVSVDSTPGAGATFRVELPLDRAAFRAEEVVEGAAATSEIAEGFAEKIRPVAAEAAVLAEKEGDNADLPLCLVVEDNLELQGFIREQLIGRFRVLLAPNGRAGLTTAIEQIPDLIISDVMMPEMDGNALCAALKTDERTSHIPVILLTARAGQESRLQGLETGADDYLTKPFDSRELLVRAHNLVQQREKLRRQFSRTVILQPKDIALTSTDERFLQRIQETLDAQLGNEQFSVEELAAAAGMSRSQLHRKLTALIDQPPVEFIRNFRLRRAKEMLEAGAGNVSEVCYEVGFGSPAYFSKAFKEAFGMSPSEVRRK